MKHTFFSPIGVIVILSVSLYSCNKADSNPVAKTADKIEGTYKLVSMHWEGDPVDVNADGLKSKDIMSELMALPTNAQNIFQSVVLPMNSERSIGAIGFQFPMQNVSVGPDGAFPTSWMTGNTLQLNISYKIEHDGTLNIEHFDALDMPEFDSRVEMNRINNGTVRFDLKGTLIFSVNYTLYDHISGQLVTDTLHYELEKVYSAGY